MKFKFNYDKNIKLSQNDAQSFSSGNYECRYLLQTMSGKPVAIMKKKNGGDVWKVQYGFSTVFFNTYGEALEFCRGRFCDLNGNPFSKMEG